MAKTIGNIYFSSECILVWQLEFPIPPYLNCSSLKSPDIADCFSQKWCFFLDVKTYELCLCQRRNGNEILPLRVIVVLDTSECRERHSVLLYHKKRGISNLPGYDQYIIRKLKLTKKNKLLSCASCIFQDNRFKKLEIKDEPSNTNLKKGLSESDLQISTYDNESNTSSIGEENKKKQEKSFQNDTLREIVLQKSDVTNKTRSEESKNKQENSFQADPMKRSGRQENAVVNIRGLVALSKDLQDMFLNETNCDVTISVGNKKYPTHKFMLQARSPVFQAMLTHDMVEKNRGVITIPDCDPSIFHDFLLYLYAGGLDNITHENVLELYKISDKYDVIELKVDCTDFIVNNLTVDIIEDVITLATRYSESEMLARATEFFVANAESILPSVKWQEFIQANPIQANELIIKAFRNVGK